MKLEPARYSSRWIWLVIRVLRKIDRGFAWVSSLQTRLLELQWKIEDKYCQCSKCKERRKEQ